MRNYCTTCVADKTMCERCMHNPKYADYPTQSYYQRYIPTCPKGRKDCVCDPAYIKCYHPKWYKDLYGDITPEEAAKEHCNVDDEYCYDDEDK